MAAQYDQNGKKRIGDIWTRQKATSDYLHHLKFEFMQFVFFGQCLYFSFNLTEWTRELFIKGGLSMTLQFLTLNTTKNQRSAAICLIVYHISQLVAFTLILSPNSRKTIDFKKRKIYHFFIGVMIWLGLMFFIIFMYFNILYADEWGVFRFASKVPRYNNLQIYWFRIEILIFPLNIIYAIGIANLYVRNRKGSTLGKLVS